MELLKKLKLGVEIQDFTEPNLSQKEIRNIVKLYKEEFKEFNGKKSLHGPFIDLKPSSPDLLIRQVSYKKYFDTIKIAKELDIDYIIFHSQINPYLNEGFIRELNNKQSKDFWNKILDETKYKGTILIENIFEESPNMLKEYIEKINNPKVKVNLDIGHAKLGKVKLEEWIRSLAKYIEYIHIHSNNGIHDKHERPSQEEIDQLYKLLEKYKLNPILSLEYNVDDLDKEIKRYY